MEIIKQVTHTFLTLVQIVTAIKMSKIPSHQTYQSKFVKAKISKITVMKTFNAENTTLSRAPMPELYLTKLFTTASLKPVSNLSILLF